MAHVGFSDHGIAEDFALDGPRSFYGASKLASEQLIQEYVHAYGMRALINRCGILTGPWQMGKVDQGIVTLWVARHHYGRPLRYTGFSGLGKQVRDVLHIEDLFDLLLLQMEQQQRWDGRVYNVGGGNELSVSLRELTELCSAATGQRVPIEGMPETNSVDLRLFITDARKVQHDYGWRPQRSVPDTIRDILAWVREYEGDLRNILA
jgi:CDP-paratose 2-epimerase